MYAEITSGREEKLLKLLIVSSVTAIPEYINATMVCDSHSP